MRMTELRSIALLATVTILIVSLAAAQVSAGETNDVALADPGVQVLAAEQVTAVAVVAQPVAPLGDPRAVPWEEALLAASIIALVGYGAGAAYRVDPSSG